jgi:hypothetical protein
MAFDFRIAQTFVSERAQENFDIVSNNGLEKRVIAWCGQTQGARTSVRFNIRYLRVNHSAEGFEH